jgi:tight adherence protein B
MPIVWFGGFLGLSFAIILVALRPKKSEKDMEKRLKVLALALKSEDDAESEALALPGKQDGGIADKLGEYLQRFDFSDDLELLILHANSKSTVGGVVGGSLLIAAAAGIVMHYAFGILPLDLVAVAVGSGVRWGLLKYQKSRRLKLFNNALADAIELIARALRAGHSMSSSIEIVAEQSPPPLNSEFAIVFQQQKFGIPFRDALLQLGDRVPSKDLHFLITAILVQKETGGDLTEILDRTTHVIRDRVRIEGEIKTYTAQGRLTGWILGALPIIMLVILNIVTPGYSAPLFHDPLGQDMLYVGGGLIVIGGLIIRKIVNIQV